MPSIPRNGRAVRPEPPPVVRAEFDRLARDGAIGDPAGRPAYAYIRVSSDEQAIEGRYGLPRQLEAIHTVASEQGWRIPWELVYADDFTGFQFEGRPALTALRARYRDGGVNAVVMEHLDRLSRDADWHQGYLLHEMKQAGIVPVFWKRIGSRVERAVLGAVAQDGMEEAKRRMADGTRRKARNGRVTAKIPPFGYRFADSQGRLISSPGRDTHLAIDEREAEIVRLIFEQTAEGVSMRKVAEALHAQYPTLTPRGKLWHQTRVRYILTNPVYKGEYVANRWLTVSVPKYGRDGTFIKECSRRVEGPREDWIIVAVPSIVTPELWDRANAMRLKNRSISDRNSRGRHLLSSLLKCGECGRTWFFQQKQYYRCSGHFGSTRHARDCSQLSVPAETLEAAVWSAVCDMLTKPDIVCDALDKLHDGDASRQLAAQIAYLERQIEDKRSEDDDLYKAYRARVFDEYEYAARRQSVKGELEKLRAELAALQARVVTPDMLAAQKSAILALAAAMKQGRLADAPHDLKRSILKRLIDRIVVDGHKRTLRIEGTIPIDLSFDQQPASQVVSIPAPT